MAIEFDEDKVNACFQELVEVFQKHKLTVGEIILAYGNLGYTLGASIEGYKDKGPPIEELEKLYYSKPTLGNALMVQGFTITSWFDDYNKQKSK